jgi:virginiamycin B lyase
MSAKFLAAWLGCSLLWLSGDSRAQTITYFRVAGVAWGIAVGPDGNLWFPTAHGVAKMTPSGSVTIYPTPKNPGLRSMITAGPDGRMWFTNGDRIGAITMDGVVTEYPVPPDTNATGIATGVDGRVWFGGNAVVGRITPAGLVTMFPTGKPRTAVVEMATGADGNVWFVEPPENSIGRITPGGEMTHFATVPGVCCGPVSITSSKDGGLWLAFNQGSTIARVSTAGAITSAVFVNRSAVVVRDGPDAGIWVGTEHHGIGSRAAIGRVSSTGVVEVVDLSTAVPRIMDMVAGPDGNLWATLYPPSSGCIFPFCPPPDPTPPLGIVRVDLSAAATVPALS